MWGIAIYVKYNIYIKIIYRSFSINPLRQAASSQLHCIPFHSCIVLRGVFYLFNSFLVNIHFHKQPRDEILRANSRHQSFDSIAEFSCKRTLQYMTLLTNNCVRSGVNLSLEVRCITLNIILSYLGCPSRAHRFSA